MIEDMSIHKKGFDGSLNRKKEVEVDERISPAGEQCERLILDGTHLDSVVREEQSSGRPWIEILVDSQTRAVVGMKVTMGEVADEL